MRNRVTKSNGQVRSMYRRLGREDLVTFDREAKDLVLSAIDQGCLGRISAKGHCILRNNAGGTASVPRNMTTPNRSAQNARADIKRLLREHRQEEVLEPEPPSPEAAAQRMTVSRAFVEHGAAFSRWFDAQEGGLPADAVVDVAFGSAGLPSFAVGIEQAEDPAAEEPQHQQEPAEQESPAMAEQTTEPTPVDESPEEVLARVRAALGEDPEVARLEARVAELEEALQAERERAERAASRLALIQEAMTA